MVWSLVSALTIPRNGRGEERMAVQSERRRGGEKKTNLKLGLRRGRRRTREGEREGEREKEKAAGTRE